MGRRSIGTEPMTSAARMRRSRTEARIRNTATAEQVNLALLSAFKDRFFEDCLGVSPERREVLWLLAEDVLKKFLPGERKRVLSHLGMPTREPADHEESAEDGAIRF